MASGFYEIEGGTQPALPQAGKIRIWKDSSDNKTKILFPDGTNHIITNLTSETEKVIVGPNDELLVFDPVLSELRKIKASNIVPIAVQTRYVTYDEDEFTAATSLGKLGWSTSGGGTGASAQMGTYGVNGVEKAFGVVQLDTGTTSTGRFAILRTANLLQLGYCTFDQVWRLALEALSTSTERFIASFGFHDNSGAGDAVDGVYFRYSDNLNSGQWQCVTRSNNIESVINTAVAANANYNIFRIYINENATLAEFYINDVLVGSQAANIPSVAGQFTGIQAKIEKTVGINQRNLSIDYHTQKSEWSGGR